MFGEVPVSTSLYLWIIIWVLSGLMCSEILDLDSVASTTSSRHILPHVFFPEFKMSQVSIQTTFFLLCQFIFHKD